MQEKNAEKSIERLLRTGEEIMRCDYSGQIKDYQLFAHRILRLRELFERPQFKRITTSFDKTTYRPIFCKEKEHLVSKMADGNNRHINLFVKEMKQILVENDEQLRSPVKLKIESYRNADDPDLQSYITNFEHNYNLMYNKTLAKQHGCETFFNYSHLSREQPLFADNHLQKHYLLAPGNFIDLHLHGGALSQIFDSSLSQIAETLLLDRAFHKEHMEYYRLIRENNRCGQLEKDAEAKQLEVILKSVNRKFSASVKSQRMSELSNIITIAGGVAGVTTWVLSMFLSDPSYMSPALLAAGLAPAAIRGVKKYGIRILSEYKTKEVLKSYKSAASGLIIDTANVDYKL